MCQKITKKGQVVCQACDYGPVVGTIVFQNPHKTEPKLLYSCSNCGKIAEYDMYPEELFSDWIRRGTKFRFFPNKCFRKEKLEALYVSLTEKGINPHEFIPSRFLQKKEELKKNLVLVKV